MTDYVRIGNSEMFRRIVDAVGAVTGVPTIGIMGRQKSRPESQARQMVVYVAHLYGHMSGNEIAKLVQRDHTTITHSLQSVRRRLDANPTLQHDIESVVARLWTTGNGAADKATVDRLYATVLPPFIH